MRKVKCFDSSDAKYYLANQIHPVVCRLCDPIEGTDSAHIAECLGKFYMILINTPFMRLHCSQEIARGQPSLTLRSSKKVEIPTLLYPI